MKIGGGKAQAPGGVLWIYYSALIFLFGAELTSVWAESHSGSIQPKPGAVSVRSKETIEPQRAA